MKYFCISKLQNKPEKHCPQRGVLWLACPGIEHGAVDVCAPTWRHRMNGIAQCDVSHSTVIPRAVPSQRKGTKPILEVKNINRKFSIIDDFYVH